MQTVSCQIKRKVKDVPCIFLVTLFSRSDALPLFIFAPSWNCGSLWLLLPQHVSYVSHSNSASTQWQHALVPPVGKHCKATQTNPEHSVSSCRSLRHFQCFPYCRLALSLSLYNIASSLPLWTTAELHVSVVELEDQWLQNQVDKFHW